MLGIIIVAGSTFFQEIAASIGKFEFAQKKESIYSMGFLNLFWSTVIFIGIALLFPSTFLFSFDSLPTLIPRLILEVIGATVFYMALIKAQRSTFGFLRTLTIPLLLIVDIILGYTIGARHLIGMGIVMLTFLVLFVNHNFKKEGAALILFTAMNAVITISLYKYNIEHYNSVVAEGVIAHGFLLIYFFFAAHYVTREHPFRLMRKRPMLLQSLAAGAASAAISFAYLFSAASIITAAKRGFQILWSIVSGNKVFHEHHILVKISAGAMLTIGILMLL